MTNTNTTEFAAEIVNQMSDDDRANFQADEWLEGAAALIAVSDPSDVEDVTAEDLLEEIERQLAA